MEPTQGLVARFVSGCLGVLLAAVALYVAVQVLLSIWVVLAVLGVVIGFFVTAVWWWRRSRSPW